jgi:microcystin-dependent protein
MATEPFIGEIRAVSFNFAPKNWALCNGQLLPIAQNQALFSILGTTYGGNGQTTFALPNLQGRVPVHVDSQGGSVVLGQSGGVENVTLGINQIGQHTHLASAQSGSGTANAPGGNLPGASTAPVQAYGASPSVGMNPGIVGVAGGSQPHTNLQPSLVVNYVICLQGIFPSRN